MKIDDARMAALMEESQDLHSTAMRRTREAVEGIVQVGRERRARGDMVAADARPPGHLRRSLLAAVVIGGGAVSVSMLFRMLTSMSALSAEDVMMLQTAAAIENLGVGVYKKAADLPPEQSGTSIPAVRDYVAMAIQHHTDHATAFNAAATRLGGAAQTGIDQAVNDAVIAPALGRIRGPADVIALAQAVEDTATQTYIKYGGAVDDKNAVRSFASIAAVEAQHSAVLLAVGALLAAGAPELITISPPVDASKLPAGAGSVGFPFTFYKTEAARPAAEGAVK